MVGGFLGVVVVLTMDGWLPIPIGIMLGLYVALLIAYHNVRTQRDELRARFEPKAELRYSDEHVRYGSLRGGEEFRHVVDVVNLSNRPLLGCRLVLESSDPDEPHVTYPNSPLGDRIGNPDGTFVLNPGDGKTPTFQIDVFQEFRPTHAMGSPAGPSEVRYLYSDPSLNIQRKFFRDKRPRNVVLRLESVDMPTAKWITLRLCADDNGYEVTVV